MKIGIIGLGYVGLPLVIQFAKSDTQVLGIDVDDKKVEALNRGESYIKHIPNSVLQAQERVEWMDEVGSLEHFRVTREGSSVT